MTTEERRREIIGFLKEAAEMLMRYIENEVPESGRFQGHSVSFLLTETENVGMLLYRFDVLRKGNQRELSLGLRRVGSSYHITTRIFRGTNTETIEFLHFTEEQLNEFTDSILDMMDNADERDDRFIK